MSKTLRKLSTAIPVRLAQDDFDRLTEKANESGISRSVIIRQAVRKFLAEE